MRTALVNEIIIELLGSTKILDDALEERDMSITDLTTSELTLFDSTIFLCDCCGWWDYTDVISDDGVCNDCTEQ